MSARGRFAWPVLDVKVTNSTGWAIFFYQARWAVADSHTDLRPATLVLQDA